MNDPWIYVTIRSVCLVDLEVFFCLFSICCAFLSCCSLPPECSPCCAFILETPASSIRLSSKSPLCLVIYNVNVFFCVLKL